MSDLMKNIKLESEREALLVFIDKVESKLFEPDFNLLEYVNSELKPEIQNDLKSYLGLEEQREVEEIFTKLKKLKSELKSLPKITIVANIDPDSNTIDMVKNYLKDVADKPVLIDFVKDPSIIGGASVENDGYIFEHSFRNYFEKRREAKNGL